MRALIITAIASLALTACATPTETSAPESSAATVKASSSKMNQHRVDQALKKFDLNADGIITLYERHEVMNQYRIVQTFKTYDLNADGIITLYEQDEVLTPEFVRLDPDGDGYFQSNCGVVKLQELSRKYGPRHPGFIHCYGADAHSAFRHSKAQFLSYRGLEGDVDGDGGITWAELEGFLAARNMPLDTSK